MKISDLEFYLVELPRTAPHAPLRALLVRIATFRGIEGWGEARLAWRADELVARRETLLPTLADRSIFDVEELHRLDGLSPPALVSALEMAMWDAIGQAVRQPLCHLWGGLYRKRVPLAVELPLDSREEVVARARQMTDQGFHIQTVRASGDWRADLALLSAVRDAVGDRNEFRLDGNGLYDGEAARELCAELEAVGLQFFRDPLRSEDIAELAALRRQTNVPLAVSRGIRGPADVLAIDRARAVPYVVFDLDTVGGLNAARKCVIVAEAAEVAPLLDARDCLGLATAAMSQLAAAVPVLRHANPSGYDQLQDDILTEPLEMVGGMSTVPQTPGLGVQVDRAKLDRYSLA